jgi:hypothetical protein
MNREKAIRLLYFNLLFEQVTYELGIVSVWDEKAEDDTNNIYILLENQSATNAGNFSQNAWECDIDIRMVAKQQDGVTKDITDDVAEQVEGILYRALQRGAETNGYQITNFVLQNLDYDTFSLTSTRSEINVTYTFRQTVTKTTNY